MIPGLKRQTEPTTPTPDPKRPRQDSAKPSDLAPSPESTTPTTNPTIVPNPSSFTNMPPAKQQEFMEKFLKLQSELKQEWATVQRAQTDGSPPDVLLRMRTDLGKKLNLYRQLSAIIPGQKQPPTSTGTAPAPSLQSSPHVPAIPTSTTTSATEPHHSNPAPPAPEPAKLPPSSSTMTAEIQNPSVPNSVLPPKEPYSPEIVTQLHRLMQQQHQQGILPVFLTLHSLTHL
jgi:hypothetical protein